MKGLEKKIRRGERGSALALSAIAMLSILLAAGLGVDISRFYRQRPNSRMQQTPQHLPLPPL
jgi:hypothetical protein